jgi:hypothetical protein
MRQPVCNLCEALHLDTECPRGVGFREDLIRRRPEIDRLVTEEEKRGGHFRSVEEEMDARYEPSGKLDSRKVQ